MTYNQKDISNQIIEMNKQYRTRRGDNVMVLCTDRNNISGNTVVYMIVKDGGIYVSNKNGKNSFSSEFDLVEYSPYDDLKEGDIVIVSDIGGESRYRIFSHVNEDNNLCVFIDGKSSGATTTFKFCRKATEDEIADVLCKAGYIGF